ncbi:hypothetical protein MASR2M70_08460 [Bacillota bacterium]
MSRLSIKRSISLLLLTCLLAFTIMPFSAAAAADDPDYEGYIVRLKQNGSVLRSMSGAPESYIKVASAEEAYLRFGEENIEFIEPDYKLYELGEEYEPSSWAMQKIKARGAWGSGLNGNGVKVAVIDSGVRTSHEDFTEGLISPVQNFTNDGLADEYSTYHGTAVSGIIAAKINNLQSPGTPAVDGLAPSVNIIPMRVFSKVKTATASMAVAAIEEAISQGCQVINLSIGIASYSAAFEEVCIRAAEAGIILVAASGNSGGEYYFYPASFNSVISVGATTAEDSRASFSQYNDRVFAVAPGHDITCLGVASDSAYDPGRQGTSFSAPMVSSLAAMAKQHNPLIGLESFRRLLTAGVEDLGEPGRDNNYGYGRIDAEAFVRELTREYSITYNGADSLGGDKYTANMNSDKELPVPEKADSVFLGWYDNSGLEGVPLTSVKAGSVGNREFYASWVGPDDVDVAGLIVKGYAAERGERDSFSVTVPQETVIEKGDFVIMPRSKNAVISEPVKTGGAWSFTLSYEGIKRDFSVTINYSHGIIFGNATLPKLDGSSQAIPYSCDLSAISAVFQNADSYEAVINEGSGSLAVKDGLLVYTPVEAEIGSTAKVRVLAKSGSGPGGSAEIHIAVTRPVSDGKANPGQAAFKQTNPADISIGISLYDNELSSLRLSGRELSLGSDYTLKYAAIDGKDAVILSKAMLSGLAAGKHTLSVAFASGPSAAVTISVTGADGGGSGGGGGGGAGGDILAPAQTGSSSVTVGGISLEGKLEKDNFSLSLPAGIMAEIAGSSLENPLVFRYDGAEGVRSFSLEISPAEAALAKGGILLELGGVKAYFPAGLWAGLSPSEGGNYVVTITEGSISVSFTKDGKAAEYYDYTNPITISLTGGADNIMHDKNTGRLIPRSLYSDGRIYARVYGGGSYDVKAVAPLLFSDTKGLWMESAVSFLAMRGVTGGLEKNVFGSGEKLTRGQFITMLMRLLSIDISSDPSGAFKDAAAGSYYYKALLDARSLGFAEGRSDNLFAPNEEITRQDMVVMLYRALEKCGIMNAADSGELRKFSDASLVADYARPAIESFLHYNMISGPGGGLLKPRGNASRAEAAQLLYNVLISEGKNKPGSPVH